MADTEGGSEQDDVSFLRTVSSHNFVDIFNIFFSRFREFEIRSYHRRQSTKILNHESSDNFRSRKIN